MRTGKDGPGIMVPSEITLLGQIKAQLPDFHMFF